jgi:hypothetical protein
MITQNRKIPVLSQINTEISVLKNRPGSRDPGFRDPGFESPNGKYVATKTIPKNHPKLIIFLDLHFFQSIINS